MARKGVVQRNYILPHPGHFIFFYVGLHIQYGRSLLWNQVLTHTLEFLHIGKGQPPSSYRSVGRLPPISSPDCTPAINFCRCMTGKVLVSHVRKQDDFSISFFETSFFFLCFWNDVLHILKIPM